MARGGEECPGFAVTDIHPPELLFFFREVWAMNAMRYLALPLQNLVPLLQPALEFLPVIIILEG